MTAPTDDRRYACRRLATQALELRDAAVRAEGGYTLAEARALLSPADGVRRAAAALVTAAEIERAPRLPLEVPRG